MRNALGKLIQFTYPFSLNKVIPYVCECVCVRLCLRALDAYGKTSSSKRTSPIIDKQLFLCSTSVSVRLCVYVVKVVAVYHESNHVSSSGIDVFTSIYTHLNVFVREVVFFDWVSFR